MVKIVFLITSLFFVNLIFSQNNVVKIVEEKTGNTILIQEMSRIRVKTFDGKRITGRFKIINDSTMLLKGKEISLTNIKKIKRNPLAMTVATDVALLVVGGSISVIAIYVGGAAPGIIFSGGTLATMVLGPNILKGYSSNKYKIEFVQY